MATTFKRATDKDYIECFEIIKERIRWMDLKGISHWNKFPYLEIYPLDYFKKLQDDNNLYVLLDDEKIVCFAALFNKDERWNIDDKDALYLHHLAAIVSDKKYGEEFLFRTFDYALSINKKYIRLDYKLGSPLGKYYKEFGFKNVGECKEGEYYGVLCEAKILDKKEIRKILKDKLLSNEYINKASLIIEDKVINSKSFKDANNIFIYLSTKKEASTDLIIKEALKLKKKVYVPKIIDNEMKAVLIDEGTEFIINKYAIKESKEIKEEASDLDLTIIPCISANGNLRRLGHGAGYYDRFLANINTYKMVLCLSELEAKYIPMDLNDIYMDELIDEK